MFRLSHSIQPLWFTIPPVTIVGQVPQTGSCQLLIPELALKEFGALVMLVTHQNERSWSKAEEHLVHTVRF